MQKDYSGILLCTDYDGTLSYGGVCRENIDAINDFMAHGGRFTLATGRGTYELREGDLPVTPNAPLVLMIGAQLDDSVVVLCQRLGTVADEDHKVRVFYSLLAAFHAHGLNPVVGIPNTCGVDERVLSVRVFNPRVDSVTSRSRDI